MLYKTSVEKLELKSGKVIPIAEASYQVFGKELGTAPIVLVNHALTGNSNVSGENGWWKQLIDYNHIIDLNLYSVIAINIPGNNFDSENNIVASYKEITTKDVATFFWKVLDKIGVENLFAIIGGSLGGAIAWEMIALQPDRADNLIPIATHYFSSDWVVANVHIQDEILSKSENPIETARKHAMLLYRTPASIDERFKKSKESEMYLVEDWLDFHGLKLKERFTLKAYQQMNYLLKTIDATQKKSIEDIILSFKGNIYALNVNSDLLFHTNHQEYYQCQRQFDNFHYKIINSIHGHDAFLMEYEQLNSILKPIFKKSSYVFN